MADSYQSERSTVKRLPKRGHYDRETVHQILDAGMICHVGFVAEGKTFVIPMVYVRIGQTVFLHGSSASRMLQVLAEGAEVCLTVTLTDGLVLARAAFHHSVNYRSVVVFGTGSGIEEPAAKVNVLRSLSEHLIPGRWADARVPSEIELKRTMVVAIAIREASAKVRTGPPIDEEADLQASVWAGVVPLRMAASAPIADAHARPEILPPDYVLHYDGPRGV